VPTSRDRRAASLWRPLRTPTFRNLLIADVVSDVGTFMQSVGAAWLMVSLGAGPMYIALTQTASALPFFVLALPAGSIGDIVDRRKVILSAEAWMVGVAMVLAVVTISGRMSPWLLLVLTFAPSAGDVAAGSVVWGALAARVNIQTALLLSGLGTLATTALAFVARLPETTADVSPWNHWRMPTATVTLDQGPVLVVVEYQVDADRANVFIAAMLEFARVRRRDGASRWGLFRDVENTDRYVETFLVNSWAEHLRQHDRLTQADRELQDRVNTFGRGVPNVRHLIHIP
jgi:MFS family permease